MCVCVYVCVVVCAMSVRKVNTSVFIYVRTLMYVCMYKGTCMSIHVNIYVCVYVHMN